MIAVVNKWGNSLGLRIPKMMVEESGISEGSELDISFDKGVIMLKPRKRKKYELKTLLEGINESNLHGEILTGDSVGNEIW